jgi:hypothetical protein
MPLKCDEQHKKLNQAKGFKVRSNIRGWSLVAGVLIILAACIFAYLSTRPDLPPINHLQSVRIKLLTIGEIHEDPKTAVHLGI